MGKRGKKFVRSVIGLVCFFMLVAFPHVSGSAERVIKVGSVMDLTGPLSTNIKYAYKAVSDYITYLNKEKKGINGIRVELLWADDAYKLERGLTSYKRFKDEGAVAVFTCSSPLNEALKSRLEKDKVPLISASASPPAIYPPGWIYTNRATYAPRFGAYLDWIKETWKEKRAPKIAFLTYDNPYGRGPIKEGTEYMQKLGMELVATEFIPLLPVDLTPQLTRLQEKGADFVFTNGVASTTAIVCKEAKRMGLQGKMIFAGPSEGFTEDLIRLAKDAAEGFVGVYEFGFADEDLPGVNLMKSVTAKLHGELESEYTAYIIGWPLGMIAEEAIQRAIRKVGYAKLNGTAVRDALETLKDFKTGGVLPPVNYTGGNRCLTAVRIAQIKDGKMVRLTDWRNTPDLAPK